jgi:predicted Zn-dependent protease
MLQTTPLLDELAAHGQACVDAIRAAAANAPAQSELLDAVYGLGYNALTTQKYDEAQILFSYLLAQNPAKPDYLAGMGHALAGLGQWDIAGCMHATAACLNPRKADHYLALAQVLLEMKELEKAEFVLALAEAESASVPLVQKLRAKLHARKELMAHAV